MNAYETTRFQTFVYLFCSRSDRLIVGDGTVSIGASCSTVCVCVWAVWLCGLCERSLAYPLSSRRRCKMLEMMIQMGELNCHLNVIISCSCGFSPHAHTRMSNTLLMMCNWVMCVYTMMMTTTCVRCAFTREAVKRLKFNTLSSKGTAPATSANRQQPTYATTPRRRFKIDKFFHFTNESAALSQQRTE